MSNFTFLNKKWAILAKLGIQAERYYHTDNNASMLKMRMFGEQIIDHVLAALTVEVDRFATQDDKIKLLRGTGINGAIPDLFDIVRRYGNKANHDYALMDARNHESIKKLMKSTYNLQILEYPKNRNDLLDELLTSLLEQVLLHREQSGMQ